MTGSQLVQRPSPSTSPRARNRVARIARAALAAALVCLALPLEGCAVAAFPCRVASATLKIVPVVGKPAAVPFDACADAID
jgi:hypothetical protein